MSLLNLDAEALRAAIANCPKYREYTDCKMVTQSQLHIKKSEIDCHLWSRFDITRIELYEICRDLEFATLSFELVRIEMPGGMINLTVEPILIVHNSLLNTRDINAN